MKEFVTLLLFIVFLGITCRVDAVEYMKLPIVEVYDGDTIKTVISERRLPAPLNKLSIRILGIDTPEMPAKSYLETGKLGRAKCVKEAELAITAKELVEQLVFSTGATYMKVENFKWGKFGSRIVAKVKIGRVDIATYLIDNGLAVPYDGSKKTHDWCS